MKSEGVQTLPHAECSIVAPKIGQLQGFQGLQLPDALPCGPGEEQRIETILHALAHPKTAAKHNEPVLIGKSEKMGLPGTSHPTIILGFRVQV